MASLLGNTSARRSSDNQRSLAAVPSSPSLSRSTWPANRLPNFVIMLGILSVARSGGGRALPAEPVDDRAAHHAFELPPLQPRQLLGEHRHALPIRARHARDVRAPERALGTERFEDLAQIAVDVLVRVRLARVARSAGHIHSDVGALRERQPLLEAGEGRAAGDPAAAAAGTAACAAPPPTGLPAGA